MNCVQSVMMYRIYWCIVCSARRSRESRTFVRCLGGAKLYESFVCAVTVALCEERKWAGCAAVREGTANV